MKTFFNYCCAIFCFFLSILPIFSQEKQNSVPLSYYLPAGKYATSVPTPESFFGFQVGEWHLRPDQIVAYMKTLASVSPRISVEEYGRTNEQRPLLLLTITAPENQKNLRELQRRHKELVNPDKGNVANYDGIPLVAWLGYSIHGNEPSGMNASVLVAYYLAASENPEIEQMLKNTVILLDPCFNPDGAARFAQWANMYRGKNINPDAQHLEHNEALPRGRTNHYWFDLNRDWMPLQQPESKARLAKFHEWMPNILTDHHEMGTNSTFFFQPGVPTRNNPHTPQKVYDLTNSIAKFHARALDSIGSLYYSKESFDDFYVGKGSSYPDLQGGIGILFEQASSRGHIQESINGDVRFSFTIRNQVVTSLSTLKASQALRKELLQHQHEFFESALKEADKSSIAGYVFGSSSDPVRAYYLVDILRRHNIQVFPITKRIEIDRKNFEPNSSFFVPSHQPQYRLLTAIFEKRTSFPDSLFYDISSWSLPLAFNMQYEEVSSKPSAENLGKAIESPEFPKGSIVGTKSNPYAYIFEWKGYFAPRALYRLLKIGVKAKIASESFEISFGEKKKIFEEGTVLIPLGLQREYSGEIQTLMEKIANEDGIKIYAVSTGTTASGIILGSNNFLPAELPRVAVLVGEGVSYSEAGECWHLLDERFDMNVTLLDASSLERSALPRYNVIAMVGGTYRSVTKRGADALKRWVEEGGTLIGMESAVEWLSRNEITEAAFKKRLVPKSDTAKTRKIYTQRDNDEAAQSISGAIFSATLDRTHPLCYGFEEAALPVFRSNTIFMDPSKNQYSNPVLYSSKPLLSGFISRENELQLKNSAAVISNTHKNGHVILMTDNPNFRAFWFGTNKLFLNAVFFGHLIGSGGEGE